MPTSATRSLMIRWLPFAGVVEAIAAVSSSVMQRWPPVEAVINNRLVLFGMGHGSVMAKGFAEVGDAFPPRWRSSARLGLCPPDAAGYSLASTTISGSARSDSSGVVANASMRLRFT